MHLPQIQSLDSCGMAVRFSPYDANKIAVSVSNTFGIVGAGRQHVLRLRQFVNPSNPLKEKNIQSEMLRIATFEYPVGITDCAWGENSDNIIASATCDGSIQIWNTNLPNFSPPVASLLGHKRDCQSIDWNIYDKDLLVSAGMDGTVRVWNVCKTIEICSTAATPVGGGGGGFVIYCCVWSPRNSSVLASAGADGRIRINDIRAKESGRIEMIEVRSLSMPCSDILSIDFNKYNEFQVVSGSTDGVVRHWDIRSNSPLGEPLREYFGHSLAVKRVKCNPFHERFISSASYDLSVIVWDSQTGRPVNRSRHHCEFVCGLDWSNFLENMIASTSWDRTVSIWNGIDGPFPPEVLPRRLQQQSRK